jgi:hypothetical protein
LQITVKLHVQAQQRNMDAAIAMWSTNLQTLLTKHSGSAVLSPNPHKSHLDTAVLVQSLDRKSKWLCGSCLIFYSLLNSA